MVKMARNRYLHWCIAAFVGLLACESPPPIQDPAVSEGFKTAIIIQCADQCAQMQSQIRSRGGNVTQQYNNLPFISADVDDSTLYYLQNQLGRRAVNKDILITPPQPEEKFSLSAHQILGTVASETNIKGVTGNLITPSNYSFNNLLTGATTVHQNGYRGKDVIVAVIDTGTANNREIVPVLRDTVIGGESFVDDPDEPSATSTLNGEHGTWIGTMIAGHGGIITEPDSDLAQAIGAYAPDSIIPVDDTTTVIPMFGTAPDAKIYAMKTFAASGGGTSSSTVLAAVDRIISLKTNFDAGQVSEPVAGDGSEDDPFVYDALNIQVVNFSLGGPTLFAAQELDDKVTDLLLATGIVVVASAGNEGFAAMTGASPGTGLGSIAVGAANEPRHERILRDLQNGPGTGADFRPTNHIQMASFSSRGPTADGRPGVDIVANGFASFVQGADGHVSMVSGTSLSAPTITGAAAVLRGAFPDLSAEQIRTALVKGANPNMVGARAGFSDQGFGFVDLPGSFAVIENHDLDPVLPTEPFAEPNTSEREILLSNGYPVISFNRRNEFSTRVILSPGEVRQLFLDISDDIHDLDINISGVTPSLPPAEQNLLFGDDLMATFVDAPTSIDRTRFRDFIADQKSFSVTHPQPGIARLALMGDWTNKGDITGQIDITINRETKTNPIAAGSLVDDQVDSYTFEVSADMTQVSFELSWKANWGFYPTHDLDLILTGPSGELILDGATLSSPEHVTIEAPSPGKWTVNIEGFLLHQMSDEYILRGTDQADNNLILTPLITPPDTPVEPIPPTP